jgi:prophage regulatory protein
MPPRATKSPRRVNDPIALPADDAAFVRLPTVLALYPVGETSWWNGVARGIYPRAVSLSPRVRGWNVGEFRAFLASRLETSPATGRR